MRDEQGRGQELNPVGGLILTWHSRRDKRVFVGEVVMEKKYYTRKGKNLEREVFCENVHGRGSEFQYRHKGWKFGRGLRQVVNRRSQGPQIISSFSNAFIIVLPCGSFTV